MEALQFVYWLQGALELGQQKALSETQVKIIQDHINLVLRKTTPSYNVPQMPSMPVIRSPGLGDMLRNTPQIHDAVC